MTKTRLESLGAYLPETIKPTPQLMKEMVHDPLFDLQSITGIEERRVHGENETCTDMAVKAAKDCLSRSNYKPEDIDLIIVPSISRFNDSTSQFLFEPPLSLHVKHQLGMTNAIHMDVSNACAGVVTGVYIIDSMIKSGMIKTGMVVSGEYITCIAETAIKEVTEAWDPQFGSLTVGDSATALIIDKAADDEDYIDFIELMTAAEHSELCIGKPSEQTQGFALYTNNKEMHKRERIALMAKFLEKSFKKANVTIEEENFDWIIHHQVGTKAINNFSRYIEETIDVKLPAPLNCVEKLGNTATTSHFISIYTNLVNGTLKPGSKILVIPAASGAITGCLSLKTTNLGI